MVKGSQWSSHSSAACLANAVSLVREDLGRSRSREQLCFDRILGQVVPVQTWRPLQGAYPPPRYEIKQCPLEVLAHLLLVLGYFSWFRSIPYLHVSCSVVNIPCRRGIIERGGSRGHERRSELEAAPGVCTLEYDKESGGLDPQACSSASVTTLWQYMKRRHYCECSATSSVSTSRTDADGRLILA